MRDIRLKEREGERGRECLCMSVCVCTTRVYDCVHTIVVLLSVLYECVQVLRRCEGQKVKGREGVSKV